MSKEIPKKQQMINELLSAGYSSDLIRQMGTEILYRDYQLSKKPGTAEQARFLLCDSDSQDRQSAIEDLRDLE